MKLKMMIMVMIVFMISSMTFADYIDTDRLPLGDETKRYHYVKAKLNKILNTDTNKEVTKEEMLDELVSQRIVMVGEGHTNQNNHDMQLDIIRGLHERGKTVILALEMFNPSQDSLLQAWVDGKMTEDEWLRSDGFFVSWGHNYRYYNAIFDYCRDNNIAIKGVNVPSKYASKINKVGVAGLTDEERAAIPEINLTNVQHRFAFASATQGLDASMPSFFPNMYAAHSLWDTAMGEGSIKHALANPDAVIVTLAGSFHVVYNFGIGRIIQAHNDKVEAANKKLFSKSKLDRLPFVSIFAPGVNEEVEEFGMIKVRKHLEKEKADDAAKKDKKPSGMPAHMTMMGMDSDNTPFKIVTKSLANYLWGMPLMKKEKYPSVGVSAKMQGDTLLVSRILPETIAFENGIHRGDIITAVDGKTFPNIIEYKIYMNYKNWGEKISFDILRDGEKKNITFVIEQKEDDCDCADKD